MFHLPIRPLFPALLAALVLLAGPGCVRSPYHPLPAGTRAHTLPLRPGEPQIERGRPNVLVDTAGALLSLPAKVVLLDSSVGNRRVSAETEDALRAYLHANGLTNVKVRINQYDPLGEFSRLARNRRVGFGWRWTVGLGGWALYTLLPQRLFSGDNYNPWTDTINLYSDHPAIALHEAGHAKDFASRAYPGAYGAVYMLPFVALHHEGCATADALSYLRERGDSAGLRDAYKILYPAYGTYIGGNVSQYVMPQTWVYWAGVLPGHLAGRLRAANEPDAAAPVTGGGLRRSLRAQLVADGLLTPEECRAWDTAR